MFPLDLRPPAAAALKASLFWVGPLVAQWVPAWKWNLTSTNKGVFFDASNQYIQKKTLGEKIINHR